MNVAEASPPVPSGMPLWLRRLLGAFVDLSVLVAICYLLLWSARPALEWLGRWCPLLGTLIATAYLGIMGSAAMGGQTAGHYLMGLRLSRSDGQGVTLGHSLARAAAVSIICVLRINYQHPAVLVFELGKLLGLLMQLYLLVAKRRQGWLLHDWLCDTGVQLQTLPGPFTRPAFSRTDRIFLAAVVACCMAAGTYMLRPSPHSALPPVLTILRAQPGVLGISINVTKQFPSGHTTPRIIYLIDLYLQKDLQERRKRALVASSARLALQMDSQAREANHLAVAIISVVDLGLYTSTSRRMCTHPPAEWPVKHP